MKTRIKNFEVGEPIDPGGYTIVHRATQHMGFGVTRPAAIKFLQIKDLASEEQISALTREVNMLIEVSASPNIVTVYDFNLEEEVGPWIAMEMAGRSLKHFIQDEPADPTQVRVLLRDCLQALRVCHESDPPILHCDIKPNNILSSGFGTWKVADFGMAKRFESDDTLNVVTVQYSAPELLDASLGPETGRIDLYSLGMVVYEFALGRTLFRQQFPSVHDPDAGADATEVDLRPRWMYWHTSMEMTLTPLAELIPDYPQDLSDLVAAMTAKPYRERIASAAEAAASLGDVRGAVDLSTGSESEGAAGASATGLRTTLLALVVVLLMIAAGTFFYFEYMLQPVIALADDGRYTTQLPTARVTGTIEHFPRNGEAAISMPSGSPHPVMVVDGQFVAEVPVARLGTFDGVLSIRNNMRKEVASRLIEIERVAPATVDLVLWTQPTATDARVILEPLGGEGESMVRYTDKSGELRVDDFPYGSFTIEVRHACFRTWGPNLARTEAEPERRVGVPLDQLSHRVVEQSIGPILDEAKSLAADAAAGDPDAVARVKELREQMRQLAGCGRKAEGELGERESGIFDDVDQAFGDILNGDASAGDAFDDAKQGFDEVNEEKRKPPSIGDDGGAAGGDAATGSDPQEQARDESRRVNQKMSELCARAEAGDIEAAAELVQLIEEQKRLMRKIGVNDPFSKNVMKKLQDLQGRAAAAATGDAAAFEALKEACHKYHAAVVVHEAVSGAGDVVGDPGAVFSAIDGSVLLQLDPETFRAFVVANIPNGALTSELVDHVTRLRIQGPLFNEREQELLLIRLAPAMPRLQLELRVDAWAVCRRLEADLKARGIPGVRVHAYLTVDESRMFVLFDNEGGTTEEDVFEVARTYVVDPDLLRVGAIAEDLWERLSEANENEANKSEDNDED